MSSNKRYYWLKLKENFFEDDTIQWLEEQENGKDYVIFYLKLALKSLDDNGRLVRYVGETLIPYDVKALAKLTNTSPDTVAVAMKIFIQIGLVSRLDGGEIYMNQINEMIGTETDVARRVRRHRARKALEDKQNKELLHCNSDETKSNTEIDIELEKDIEKDKEQQQEKKENDVVVDEDFKKVHKFYESNLGMMSPFNREDILDWIEDLSADVVIEALKITVENQKQYNYAKAIMKNWYEKGVKSVDDAKAITKTFNRNTGSYEKEEETPSEWPRF